ncbi:MAG: ABC transporter ATP-binding protein [Gemmatimonadaceae bacterium]
MRTDTFDPAEPVRDEAVRLSNVSVRFGALTALDGASFAVPRGGITGLIGRNGAGKSTCIGAIAGLIQPDSGNVEVFGSPVHESLIEILRRTGFLLSDPALFAYLTPRETLLFLAEAYNVPKLDAAQRTDDLIAFFELGEAADRLVDGFSTGMQKRVGIAAALIHSPELLVLDEPFEALDPLTVRKLKRLLLDYAAGGGSVLLSSHLLDAVDEICDRVVILDQGRVVIAGPTDGAKATVSRDLGSATLEELYAAMVPSGGDIALEWLTG